MMFFEKFIDLGIVKKQSPDIQRAESLIFESERKIRQIKRIIEKIGVDKEDANDLIEGCFDSIMYVIRAIMLIQGFSASGNGAHEAEVYFLKNLHFKEDEIEFMNKLRYFRNGIMYYGKIFEEEYALKVIAFTDKTISKLKDFLKTK